MLLYKHQKGETYMEKKIITTVAGIVENKDGDILCTLRDQGKYEYVSYKWEFPGGKVEAGETQHQTLARELKEELDIEVEIGQFFSQVEHDYPDFHLSMAVYKCKFLGDNMAMNVHKALKWVNPKDLLTLDWAAADFPVAEKIYRSTK